MRPDSQLRQLRRMIAQKSIAVAATPAAWFPGCGSFIDWIAGSGQVSHFIALEHGLRGELQDGVAVQSGRDIRTGIPVFSGYGHGVRLPVDCLTGVDTIVFCAQDVSHRAYTFKQILAELLGAAATAGCRVIIIDRPTPLSHLGCRGPVSSQFFPLPLPVVIPYTLGELAGYCRDLCRLDVDLDVLPYPDWQRQSAWSDTGLPWLPPSPNIPTLQSAYCYAATGLVQATNLSEGRGTCKPFEYIGAPFIDPPSLLRMLAEWRLPGVLFREVYFRPGFNKYAGEVCPGIHLMLTDPHRFDPVLTGLALLVSAARLWPDDLRIEPGFGKWLDGDSWSTGKLAALDIAAFLARAQAACRDFVQKISPFCCYD